MALGVLNNLSAIYAENNLNNTNSSLQTVLQQLSSGSKINSGADDAAGLSLVNGLQANQTALIQSETNSTEGVGLLEVADGALSQVSSMLNRAITLATEASNGTLNSTQEGAANNEYQSIMSEINNIGQTTTYNQQQVFSGNTVAIYTGDSSAAGSSVDDLNIKTLSETSVGDTGGTMSYSDGTNNVFLNLSTGTKNAQATDTLNTNGTTTIDVTYLVKGGNGAANTATTAISVGGTTNYANTANGLIGAINNAGLGLTATFDTQAQAGVTGGGTETGIQITGGLVSAGVDPSAVSTSGALNPSGVPASELLTQGQVITVLQGGTTAGTVTINSSIDTLQELANAINTGTGSQVTGFSGAPVKASVVTNGDGTQSLSLANSGSTQGALRVTTAAGATPAPVFTTGSTGNSTVAINGASSSNVTGVLSQPGVASSVTISDGVGNVGTDALSVGSSIVITNSIPNNPQSMTFIVGAGNDTTAPAGTFYTDNTGGGVNNASTMAGLIATINAQGSTLDVKATLTPGSAIADGITLTTGTFSGAGGTGTFTPVATTGENVGITNGLTSATNVVGLYTPVMGGAAAVGSDSVTAIDAGALSAVTDTLSGTFTLDFGGNSQAFTLSGANTFNTLITDINGSGLGLSATFSNHALLIKSNAPTTNLVSIAAAPASTMEDTNYNGGGPSTNALVVDAGNTSNVAGSAGTVATPSTAIIQLPSGSLTGANLTGSFTLNNGAIGSQTFVMGGASVGVTTTSNNVTTVAGSSVANLVSAINGVASTLGLTANAPGGGTDGIYLTDNTTGNNAISITPATNTLASATVATHTAPILGFTVVAGNNASTSITPSTGLVNTGDTMTGSVVVQNGIVTDTFVAGSGSDTALAGTFYTTDTDNAGISYGNTLAGLANMITAQAALGLNAQASTDGLTLTQNATAGNYTGSIITVSSVTNSLVDTTQGTYSTSTLGETSPTNLTGTFASESDTLSGALKYTIGSSGSLQTINMSAVTAAGYAATVSGLISYISANSTSGANLGISAAWTPEGSNGFGSITLVSNTVGTTGTINPSTPTTLTDTTSTANLSYTAITPYSAGLSSGSNTVYDSTSGQTSSAAGAATFAANSKSASGVATMNYTDGAGEALNTTDLLNQADAQTALNDLNVAISDVAAQDGYIGAQINTLNSVSQVMSTQQENVVSAQNAVQATDYASATANMSKYEILSQTGIAALAQANTVQQEVTKLLQ